jgi:hypothetical protein
MTLLRKVKSELPDYVAHVSIFSLDGTNIGTSGSGHIDATDRSFFTQIPAGRQLSIGDVRRGDQSGSWIVSIARPLKDRAGRFVAVLAAGTWFERFQQALRMQGLPAGSIVTIVNQKGIVVSRSVDAGNWIGSDVSNWRGAEKHFAVQEGSQITPWASDGVERITAFSRLHRARWLVNIGQPTNAAFAAVATRLAWSVAFIIGTLISRL